MREIFVKVIHIPTEQLGYNGTVDSCVVLGDDFIDSRFFTILDDYTDSILKGEYRIVIEGRDKPAENFYGDEGFI